MIQQCQSVIFVEKSSNPRAAWVHIYVHINVHIKLKKLDTFVHTARNNFPKAIS